MPKLGDITEYKLPVGGGTGNLANVGEDAKLVKGALVLFGLYFGAKAIWSWGSGELAKARARTQPPAQQSAQPGASAGGFVVHQ